MRLLAISSMIGNISAATACSGIQKERNADDIRTPPRSDFGVDLNMLIKIRARRVLRPVLNNAAASINAPSIKNTAWFPKREKASLSPIAPTRGNRTSASKLVAARGMASVTQRTKQREKIARDFWPSAVRPSGV